MHELSLVFFTFLAQTAVGIVTLSTFGFLIGKVERSGHEKALWGAFVALALGGIASLTHLGQPLRALNALGAIGQSPMSNEIIATILFGGLLFAAIVCMKFRQGSNTVKAVSLFSTFAGVVLVHTIPTIYTIESVTAWNNIYTTIYMVLTALIMGATIVFFICDSRLFKYTALISLLVGIILMPSYFGNIGLSSPSIFGEDALFWMLKLAFAGLAIVSLSSMKKGNTQFASLAVVFVAASEIAGRIGFFELWHIGM
ncbi:dimethyl sulfoxide reductase anchor subunit family protein [Vibrio panuliri]|uniref:Dimethyl sulfoxide reductase n=1 Tax=Vibrio panuliri TaxID=1381081 RepID=A0ABX3F640_9VIBR|nr:DmsC/YnfH family molybdoenzyme membrane anchor subunit [Vibrio panuliri]KAB1454786.1 hypothetical protein F7O85_18205 [Vibrio panuliri]OLQ85556.1 hypothetical protein BIY20_15905 [Vibrio panuliri]